MGFRREGGNSGRPLILAISTNAVRPSSELRSYFLHKWVMGDKRNGMAVESIRQDFQYAFTPVGYRKMQYFTLRKDCFDTLFCCLVGFTGT